MGRALRTSVSRRICPRRVSKRAGAGIEWLAQHRHCHTSQLRSSIQSKGDVISLLKLLATALPFTWPSTLEMVTILSDHMPVVAVHPKLRRVVWLVVAGGVGGVEGTSIFQHGDGDVCID